MLASYYFCLHLNVLGVIILNKYEGSFTVIYSIDHLFCELS